MVSNQTQQLLAGYFDSWSTQLKLTLNQAADFNTYVLFRLIARNESSITAAALNCFMKEQNFRTRVKNSFNMDYKGFCELITIDLDELFQPKCYTKKLETKAPAPETTSDSEFFKYAIEETDLNSMIRETIFKWRSLDKAKLEIAIADPGFTVKSIMASLDIKKLG